MRRAVRLAFSGASIAALVGGAAIAAPADLVLFNGKVLTVDPAFSIAKAVAVKDGKVIAVGGDEIARTYQAAKTVDLKGRVLMPGFNDTHIHTFPRSKRLIDFTEAKSIADMQAMIRAKVSELGPGEWITGADWDEARFSDKRTPVRADLDAAAPNNPLVLTRAGGHSSVSNSMALKLAGIDRNTEDPPTGLIERLPGGEPNGVIRERSDLVTKLVPADPWSAVRGSVVDALKKNLALGVTSMAEASGSIDDEPVGKGGLGAVNDVGLFGAKLTYKRMREIYAEQGENLPRMTLYISYPGAERLAQFPYRSGDGDDRLRLGAIGENAVDGGFTGPTAWTLADYKGQPGFRGKGRFTDAELRAMADAAAREGWQMGLHTIGDAAIQQSVNAYSKALRSIPPAQRKGAKASDPRWFLDHFTVMPPVETMKTMAEDRILIAQQPNFTYTLEGRYHDTLDPWREAHNNAIATPVKQFGLFMAFGSDDLPIGPMVGLYAATTRKGMSGEAHGLQEAVSRPEAIRMYTANGAYLSWEEKTKGTLQPGMLADMIVLDKDILTVPDAEILNIKVDATYVGGKLVFERK